MSQTQQDLNELSKRTEADKADYVSHTLFNELDRAIDFYHRFDFLVMHWSGFEVGSIINIDSYVYSSIQGTLESIRMILQKGRIGDAFCLLRKYYEACMINIYTNAYVEDKKDSGAPIVKDVLSWFKDTKKLPDDDLRKIRQYLEKSKHSKEIMALVFTDKHYREMRDRCNDYTHYNYFKNFLANDNKMPLDRIKILDELQEDLENIFILHIACIFHMNNHYMMSSDYHDCMDIGIQPEEDSQYWVATFIQDIFDKLIDVKRPDVATFIKQNTAMKLS